MTEQQFNEACRYANEQLDDVEEELALRSLVSTHTLRKDIATKIADAMDEWCRDNDLNEDDWREWGSEDDVFFNEE